jgi:hypothetical protein
MQKPVVKPTTVGTTTPVTPIAEDFHQREIDEALEVQDKRTDI